MSPKNIEHEHAKNLFLNTDKTQQEIADILNVNRRTIYLWIRKGKWEEMKHAARQAPGIILQDLYNHITEINDKIRTREDRCPTMQEVEMMRKLLNMTNVINKKHAGSYMEAFEELTFYINRKDRELGKQVVQHAYDYICGNFGDEDFHVTKDRNENIARVMKNLKREQEEEEEEEENTTTKPVATEASVPTDEVSAAVENEDTDENEGNDQDNDGISCDKEERIKTVDEIMWERLNAATTDTSKGLQGKEKTPKYPMRDFSADEISPELAAILKLPLAERPSPFRDGNTLWIIDLDHLDERYNNLGQEWGEQKMGDRIMRYSYLLQQ